MKIFTACLATETNTFSPIPTGQQDFFTVRAKDIADGTATFDDIPPFGLWRNKILARGDQFLFSLFAYAQPAGPTTAVAYESLRDELLSELTSAGPVDIVLLYLHGAMVTTGCDDCEGDLLSKVRAIVGSDVVIATELDLHCHLTETMISQADILITFKEYPHVDVNARAAELFDLAIDARLGKTQPTMALVDCRMMGLYPTSTPAMRKVINAMVKAEQREGVLSVSFVHGFPWGDVAAAGGKLLVVTDNNSPQAQAVAEELGQQVFALRHHIGVQPLSMDVALNKAVVRLGTDPTQPVVVADQSDNPGGGAPGDATYALVWLLERKIQNVGIAIFYDPQVVKLAKAAGEGATLQVRLGGKLGPTSGTPLDISVTVGVLKEAYRHRFPQIDPVTGKEDQAVYWPIGDTVALHAQGIDILVSSERGQCFSPCIFDDFGIPAKDKHLLVVKSAQHFFSAFAPIASEVIYMAAPGAVLPIMQQIPYQRMKTDNKYPWVETPFSAIETNKINQENIYE